MNESGKFNCDSFLYKIILLTLSYVEGFHFSGKKFPFWTWNDPEICCVKRNSVIIPFYKFFTKNFADFQNFKKFNGDRILMETGI